MRTGGNPTGRSELGGVGAQETQGAGAVRAGGEQPGLARIGRQVVEDRHCCYYAIPIRPAQPAFDRPARRPRKGGRLMSCRAGSCCTEQRVIRVP
jgi:hypothetical protein